MAETTNFSIPRGSRVTLNFVLTPAGPLSGTMKFTLARRANSATKIVSPKTITGNATGGTCVLTSAETNVAPAEYFWDARIVDSGSETLLGSGVCTITPIAALPTA